MKGAHKNPHVKQSCVKHTSWQKWLHKLLRPLGNPFAPPWDPQGIRPCLQNTPPLSSVPLPTPPPPGHLSHKRFVFTPSSAENIAFIPTFLMKSGLLSFSCKGISVALPHTLSNPKNNFHKMCSNTKGQTQFCLSHPV